MSKRGLPKTLRMRHDEHYVESLAASAGQPVGRIVAIDLLDPNPQQPRQVMGDLSELIASIGEKGILEPLLVRSRGERFQNPLLADRRDELRQVAHDLPRLIGVRVDEVDGHQTADRHAGRRRQRLDIMLVVAHRHGGGKASSRHDQ